MAGLLPVLGLIPSWEMFLSSGWSAVNFFAIDSACNCRPRYEITSTVCCLPYFNSTSSMTTGVFALIECFRFAGM